MSNSWLNWPASLEDGNLFSLKHIVPILSILGDSQWLQNMELELPCDSERDKSDNEKIVKKQSAVILAVCPAS